MFLIPIAYLTLLFNYKMQQKNNVTTSFIKFRSRLKTIDRKRKTFTPFWVKIIIITKRFMQINFYFSY